MDLVHEAMKMLSGTNNYLSFTPEKPLLRQPWVNTTKTIHLSVTPGEAYMHHHVYPGHNHFKFWDFEIQGSSFLYKQVYTVLTNVFKCALWAHTALSSSVVFI